MRVYIVLGYWAQKKKEEEEEEEEEEEDSMSWSVHSAARSIWVWWGKWEKSVAASSSWCCCYCHKLHPLLQIMGLQQQQQQHPDLEVSEVGLLPLSSLMLNLLLLLAIKKMVMQFLVMKRGKFTQVPILYTTDKSRETKPWLISLSYKLFFTAFYHIWWSSFDVLSIGMFQANYKLHIKSFGIWGFFFSWELIERKFYIYIYY